MFDMNMEKKMLYFVSVDNIIYEREMDIPITNDVKVVIVRASGTVSGICFFLKFIISISCHYNS